MIKWTFAYEKDNIVSNVSQETEDSRILDFVEKYPTGLLYMPGAPVSFYINLALVKFIVREMNVEEKPFVPEVQAAE